MVFPDGFAPAALCSEHCADQSASIDVNTAPLASMVENIELAGLSTSWSDGDPSRQVATTQRRNRATVSQFVTRRGRRGILGQVWPDSSRARRRFAALTALSAFACGRIGYEPLPDAGGTDASVQSTGGANAGGIANSGGSAGASSGGTGTGGALTDSPSSGGMSAGGVDAGTGGVAPTGGQANGGTSGTGGTPGSGGAVDSGTPDPGCVAACASGTCQGNTCVIDCAQTSCNNPVVCPAGIPCRIVCVTGQCRSTLDCTQASSCDITCPADTCASPILCGSGPCNVVCGSGACNSGVNCSMSSACDVQCASNACATTIVCGPGSCSADCTADDACRGGVDCSGSCSCDVTCSATNNCGTNLECPAAQCRAGLDCITTGTGCDLCP